MFEALNQPVMSYFEVKMQEYKSKKDLSVEVVKTLKSFNVMKIEKSTFPNMDFVHSFLSFQNNTDLPGGWYNSYIVAPNIRETMDECNVCNSVIVKCFGHFLDLSRILKHMLLSQNIHSVVDHSELVVRYQMPILESFKENV
ncbi:hypothetical protein GLOIN_2v1470326 [Rhizophagus irregularis DAOM 181602=DAOM 197198]|uniref:Uncharacterized protein n=1 Tax=Rhizophagus irregularis (strain DAOM 181602 / DAOM 197198 / MUCL 43194) TaxID=747089 RepID=A0A2P4QWP7_RHIID|nr:hypothetical protein GLOIN_2v1470326 [Rhizophagus irregularis DAOM 181602=DAOM 197198]POG82059.1 hypothetical protein GLOIN_2v1470326 [Rhizophagus irregularis DAOM 181602=DAOM 197198]|eukprot:XP_025188925.1 hypothetical protein GLOIN_2v1470326 [Rhizophagus irregularis DAOM 181602=DAOM 197198]